MFNSPRFVVYDFATEENVATNTSVEKESDADISMVSLLSRLTKLDYVLSDQKLTQDESTLATKIFSAIGRHEVVTEDPNSDLSFAIKTTVQSLPEMKLEEHINLARVLNSRFQVVIHFSSQYTQTSSKMYQESSSLIWIQTYSLDQIAKQPQLKAEFWNYLKELK